MTVHAPRHVYTIVVRTARAARATSSRKVHPGKIPGEARRGRPLFVLYICKKYNIVPWYSSINDKKTAVSEKKIAKVHKFTRKVYFIEVFSGVQRRTRVLQKKKMLSRFKCARVLIKWVLSLFKNRDSLEISVGDARWMPAEVPCFCSVLEFEKCGKNW